MQQMTFIPRVEEGNVVPQRARDGYISATALCQSVGKRWSDYRALKSTEEFLQELMAQTKLSENELIHVVSGGNPAMQGTWIHPYLAIHLGQWLSRRFAVKVSQWVVEWQQGRANALLPVHIDRYMQNRAKVPYTHFSMLNELTLNLIAPLEQAGYTLPQALVPDISEGRLFCKWLRDHRGVDTDALPTYDHAYPDGRTVQAKLYPNEFYEDFRRHFNEVWLPDHAPRYFAARDSKALSFVSALLLPAA